MEQTTQVKIKLLSEKAKLPCYQMKQAACMDVHAAVAMRIPPHSVGKVPLGFAMQLPAHSKMEIRPRSGLASKGIIAILGTIDSDYRGEVSAIMHNTTPFAFEVLLGMRIAQMEYYPPKAPAVLEEVLILDETDRGTGGFGHTGH